MPAVDWEQQREKGAEAWKFGKLAVECGSKMKESGKCDMDVWNAALCGKQKLEGKPMAKWMS